MVNTKDGTSTRAAILDILRNNGTSVSGEKIAASLGVSRVAVWKGIQSLNENGYTIHSSSGGYRLEGDDLTGIFPWEFGSSESRFRHWAETDSTMNRARELALSGADNGMVITASRQSEGRGTGEKKWESPEGGLFFTLITRPSLNWVYAHRQILAAQNAMTSAIRTLSGADAWNLWPNDIYIESGKVGGILMETLSSGNRITFSNLGIGINTCGESSLAKNVPENDSLPGRASLSINRKELLKQFLREFEKTAAAPDEIVPAWNTLCPLTGKKIDFCSGALRYTGIFRGVDAEGYALIDESRYGAGTISILHKGCEK